MILPCFVCTSPIFVAVIQRVKEVIRPVLQETNLEALQCTLNSFF